MMKCGFYGIYAINCGLNARKQKKENKKMLPSFADKLDKFFSRAQLCRQQRPYSLLTACHVGYRQRIFTNWYAGGRRRLDR
jgi:hypothetical protein